MKHCCAMMKSQVESEDKIIIHSDKFSEYKIPVRDGGTSGIVLIYCPWCGKKLPNSTR